MPSSSTVWYRNNPEAYKARKKQIHARKRSIAAYVASIKRNKRCLRCGFADYRALEFHHRDPANKILAISHLVQRGWSLQRIDEEIAKCDLICANCRAIEHFARVAEWNCTSLRS